MTALEFVGLDALSHLLGLPVLRVWRGRPAHEAGHHEFTRDGMRFVPAGSWDQGIFHPARQWWCVELLDGRRISFESRDVKRAKDFTARLAALGSAVVLDNKQCRTVLRLLHEILEARQ